MKRLGFITLMILLSRLTFGQDFDNLMSKKQFDCSDISYNSGLYFIKYMQENKIDSAQYLLEYWESKCGKREPIFRARILLALRQNEFTDSLLTEGTLNNIFNYQNRMDMIKYSKYYSYDEYKSYYGFTPPGQEFDKYTQELAKSIIKKYEPESVEYLLSEFYGANYDTIFSKIQNKPYGQSTLTKEYEKDLEKYVNMPEFHLSWVTGLWIPTGKLKKLGIHPELGFQMGSKQKKMNYDLIMTFKFLNSPNDYYARRTKSGDSLELTNHFFGGHIGFDIGRDIYSKNGQELQLTGGIAFDGFDALEEDKDKDLESESTWTYNFNLGLGYRYYVTNTFYLGLRAKYNIVDYSLNNVVDFTGNPITIQFIIGEVNNVFRNNNLKALKYKLRK
jgi:hypothetical protein